MHSFRSQLRLFVLNPGISGFHKFGCGVIFAGITQRSHLFVPADGKPVLMARKSFQRARQESALENVILFTDYTLKADISGDYCYNENGSKADYLAAFDLKSGSIPMLNVELGISASEIACSNLYVSIPDLTPANSLNLDELNLEELREFSLNSAEDRRLETPVTDRRYNTWGIMRHKDFLPAA